MFDGLYEDLSFLPLSYLFLVIFVFPLTASLAIVKSRDMHWGLMAQKEHKGINLGSLRMLLVADGANPCKLTCPNTLKHARFLKLTISTNFAINSIQIMHIREVVSKNYLPRGNFIKV